MFGRKKPTDKQIKIGDRLIDLPKDSDPNFRIPTSLQKFANNEEGSTDKGIPPCRDGNRIRACVEIQFNTGLDGFDRRY